MCFGHEMLQAAVLCISKQQMIKKKLWKASTFLERFNVNIRCFGNREVGSARSDGSAGRNSEEKR